MRAILDVSSQRLIKILELLLLHDKWITIKDISKTLNVSEKTINDDLKYIKEAWGDEIGIETSFSSGTRTTQISVSNVVEIESEILMESIPVKFIKTLFFYPYHDLNYYADKLHVSRSTLYRYLPRINNYLNPLGITIDRKLSLYFIHSKNEMLVRKFFTAFFIDISGYTVNLFLSQTWHLFFETRIKSIFTFNHELITDLEMNDFIVLYYVSLFRESQGFSVNVGHYFGAKRTPFTQSEIDFFSNNFYQVSEESLYKIEESLLIHRVNSTNIKNDDNLNWKIDSFLVSVFNNFGYQYAEKDIAIVSRIIKDIYITETLFPVPYHVLSNRFSFFTKQVKETNPLIYNKVVECVNDLSNLTSVNFNQQFDYILYILVVSLPKILNAKLAHKILVISNHCLKHAEFMAKTISSHLQLDQNFQEDFICIPESELTTINVNDFSIIISNSAYIQHGYQSILVNDFPTEYNVREIKNAINLLSSQH